MYQAQPLAQHWSRVSKVNEELGEAVNELIGITGQNPRKGFYGSHDNLIKELLDTCTTALYAVEHFTKTGDTMSRLEDHIDYQHDRIFNGTDN
jgi:hypothetical protein